MSIPDDEMLDSSQEKSVAIPPRPGDVNGGVGSLSLSSASEEKSGRSVPAVFCFEQDQVDQTQGGMVPARPTAVPGVVGEDVLSSKAGAADDVDENHVDLLSRSRADSDTGGWTGGVIVVPSKQGENDPSPSSRAGEQEPSSPPSSPTVVGASPEDGLKQPTRSDSRSKKSSKVDPDGLKQPTDSESHKLRKKQESGVDADTRLLYVKPLVKAKTKSPSSTPRGGPAPIPLDDRPAFNHRDVKIQYPDSPPKVRHPPNSQKKDRASPNKAPIPHDVYAVYERNPSRHKYRPPPKPSPRRATTPEKVRRSRSPVGKSRSPSPKGRSAFGSPSSPARSSRPVTSPSSRRSKAKSRSPAEKVQEKPKKKVASPKKKPVPAAAEKQERKSFMGIHTKTGRRGDSHLHKKHDDGAKTEKRRGVKRKGDGSLELDEVDEWSDDAFDHLHEAGEAGMVELPKKKVDRGVRKGGAKAGARGSKAGAPVDVGVVPTLDEEVGEEEEGEEVDVDVEEEEEIDEEEWWEEVRSKLKLSRRSQSVCSLSGVLVWVTDPCPTAVAWSIFPLLVSVSVRSSKFLLSPGKLRGNPGWHSGRGAARIGRLPDDGRALDGKTRPS